MEGLAQDDPGVLDSVVVIDLDVALRIDDEIESPVFREKGQHVVEKRDPGGDRRGAGPVNDEPEADVGLAGFPMQGVFSGFRHGRDAVWE